MTGPRLHTPASYGAAALMLVLALLQVWWSDAGHGLSASGLLVPFTLLSAGLLVRSPTFEPRLAVVLACVAQLVLVSLAVAVGLPGQSRVGIGPPVVEAFALPLVAIGLLALDRRSRRSGQAARPRSDGSPHASPYAR